MVFTHACVAHQSFQETSTVLKANRKIQKNPTNYIIDISSQGHKTLPNYVIANRLHIVELIAEGNYLNENVFNMPIFPFLKKLSITNNKIRNIGTLLCNLRKSCPNLEVLNIDSNPGWPTDTQNDSKYRKTATSVLSRLLVLNRVETYRIKRVKRCSTDSLLSDSSMESA